MLPLDHSAPIAEAVSSMTSSPPTIAMPTSIHTPSAEKSKM